MKVIGRKINIYSLGIAIMIILVITSAVIRSNEAKAFNESCYNHVYKYDVGQEIYYSDPISEVETNYSKAIILSLVDGMQYPRYEVIKSKASDEIVTIIVAEKDVYESSYFE